MTGAVPAAQWETHVLPPVPAGAHGKSRRNISGMPRLAQHPLLGIMRVIVVKLIMGCSGSGVLRWRR
jgi:hypothetical protein